MKKNHRQQSTLRNSCDFFITKGYHLFQNIQLQLFYIMDMKKQLIYKRLAALNTI